MKNNKIKPKIVTLRALLKKDARQFTNQIYRYHKHIDRLQELAVQQKIKWSP